MRERFHPFNTARIVRRALSNSDLIAQHSPQMIETLSAFDFSSGTGLLYPGDNAKPIDDLKPSERPTQLIILDGTWHHAKTLIRDIPKLQNVPRFSFSYTEPSRYRIRREPNLECLSTIEATVAALQSLEPETTGLNTLLAAFDFMIDNQLASPMSDYGARRIHRKSPLSSGVPKIIRDHLEKVVVVYGETMPGIQKDLASPDSDSVTQDSQWPCYWTAERLVTGEKFESAIRPDGKLTSTFLGHLELPESVFSEAPPLKEVSQSWQLFLRPGDHLAFYYSNIPKLLSKLKSDNVPLIHLKSIRMMSSKNKTLENVLADLNLKPVSNRSAGRAGKRLASTHALVQYLHTCGKSGQQE